MATISEWNTQKQLHDWCLKHPESVMFSYGVPNGIKADPAAVAIYKKNGGLVPGAPDYVVITTNGITINFELKQYKTGKMSEAQKLLMLKAESIRYPYYKMTSCWVCTQIILEHIRTGDYKKLCPIRIEEISKKRAASNAE